MERLDKFLCDSGVGTRSQVKAILKAGRVTVDGKTEKDNGRKIDPKTQRVELDGEILGGYLINLALRIFPKDVLNSILDSAVKGLVDGLKYSTLIWGLCPKENYPAGAEMYLSDESTKEIRRQTDIFYVVRGIERH